MIEKYSQIEVQPNSKTIPELIEYVENNWGATRVKTKELHYMSLLLHAKKFMEELGQDTSDFEEEIRRYKLPNKTVFLMFGMNSEYITTESGLKYYELLTILKGISQEDIDSKNTRWLQYMIILERVPNWQEIDQELKDCYAELKVKYGVEENK